MPGAEDGSPSVSMLSEVSGMDNSLSLAEIDRIIGNLIGKEAERSVSVEQNESQIAEMSPHGVGGLDRSHVPDSPNASAHFDDIPAAKHSPQRAAKPGSFLSPAVQRLLSPQFTPSPGMHDSPTEVPSYVSPPPLPAGFYLFHSLFSTSLAPSPAVFLHPSGETLIEFASTTTRICADN